MKAIRFAVALVALALAGGLMVPAAQAVVPTGPPTFDGDPLTIDNPFFPFPPGAYKEFTGSDRGTKTGAKDYYLVEGDNTVGGAIVQGTRRFRLDRMPVQTRILVEEAFDGGEIVERSFNYFAQADDGTVYYFGEVVNNFVAGSNGTLILNHNGSWLVGGPRMGTDPLCMNVDGGPCVPVGNATVPAVFMPANPELDDVFMPEDLYPVVAEIDTVVGVDLDVLVLGKKYDGAIKIKETNPFDSSYEYKWYAPGLGVVKVQTQGETLRLNSFTGFPPPGN